MKKESIKMFRDLLLVRKLPAEDKTAGGIIMPDELKDEGRYLEVVQVGTDVRGIEVGDKVVTIGEHPGGQDVRVNGEDLIIMRDKYIFGVVER